MNSEHFFTRHSEITGLVQKEFERNIAKHGDKIKCSKGCSKCCHQIFNITLIDEFVIKKYVTSLPDGEKSVLKDKARNYLADHNTSENNKGEYSNQPGKPCPALSNDGVCTIYEARPLICRRFGPPVFDYKNPSTIYACELNFKTGEEIFDDELIPAQTILGKVWDKFKTDFNLQFDKKTKTSTTIAEAILNS